MKSIIKKIIFGILEIESRIVLARYKPKIVAITGSVGKTSAKDAIFTVLSSKFITRKNQKSFNTEIGVPLTILGCENAWSNIFKWIGNIFKGLGLIIFGRNYPEYLVLEVGADKPGDIKSIAKWLKPDIVVMTKVSDVPVHVEFFPSAEALLHEKEFLAKYLKKDGTLILFADDKKVLKMRDGASQKTMTYGISSPATVRGSNESIIYDGNMPRGMSFKIDYNGNSIPASFSGALGKHHIYPLLSASAVGIACGISILDIVKSFSFHVPPKGRMNIIPGVRDSVILDDTYNSSPDACYEALNTLASIKTSGKKIAILGDMLELGKYSQGEHQKIGEYAKEVANIVIAIGEKAKMMPGISRSFTKSIEALDYVKEIISSRDVVLVKGSQSIRMERIVKEIMREPEKAESLLVRQEPEWLAKK